MIVLLFAACKGAPAQSSFSDRDATAVVAFECNRCHVVEGNVAVVEQSRNCAACHQTIQRGGLWWRYPRQMRKKWQEHITHYLDVPSLVGVEARFERDWFVEFLLEPHSLRPHMGEEMPRFAMSREEAEAIARYFFGDSSTGYMPGEPFPVEAGDVEAGRELFSIRGCSACHALTGAALTGAALTGAALTGAALTGAAMTGDEGLGPSSKSLPSAVRLAPDLRWTRERMRPEVVWNWLENPAAMKPDTLMPTIAMTDEERRLLVAFLFEAELSPLEVGPVPERLPVLERPVAYQEVALAVFQHTCWHCHSNPAGNNGDGGPGNTGGFGYEGAGLDLGSYEGIRRSNALELGPDGVPIVVAHMMARHGEVRGEVDPDRLGMPLGLPPMSLEQIQLVESWIVQGAKGP